MKFRYESYNLSMSGGSLLRLRLQERFAETLFIKNGLRRSAALTDYDLVPPDVFAFSVIQGPMSRSLTG